MEGHRTGEDEGIIKEMNKKALLTFVWRQVGGNRNAREFFEAQSDWDDSMSITQKYNTKAAALYRDKVATIAQGKSWNASSSSAQKHVSMPSYSGGGGGGRSDNSFQNGYQDSSSGSAAGYQNLVNTPEFKDQKEQYFSKVQEQNALRSE